jgi:hypothetical protein
MDYQVIIIHTFIPVINDKDQGEQEALAFGHIEIPGKMHQIAINFIKKGGVEPAIL